MSQVADIRGVAVHSTRRSLPEDDCNDSVISKMKMNSAQPPDSSSAFPCACSHWQVEDTSPHKSGDTGASEHYRDTFHDVWDNEGVQNAADYLFPDTDLLPLDVGEANFQQATNESLNSSATLASLADISFNCSLTDLQKFTTPFSSCCAEPAFCMLGAPASCVSPVQDVSFDNFDLLAYADSCNDACSCEGPDTLTSPVLALSQAQEQVKPECEKSYIPTAQENGHTGEQISAFSDQIKRNTPPQFETVQEQVNWTKIKERPHSKSQTSQSPRQERKVSMPKTSKRRNLTEPKRPKNGFIRFSVKYRHEIARTHPRMDNRNISKLLGARWRKMTPEEKKPYEEEFAEDIKLIRDKNPRWQYAPSTYSQAELVDPMPSRLRPFDKIKPKQYRDYVCGTRLKQYRKREKHSHKHKQQYGQHTNSQSFGQALAQPYRISTMTTFRYVCPQDNGVLATLPEELTVYYL